MSSSAPWAPSCSATTSRGASARGWPGWVCVGSMLASRRSKTPRYTDVSMPLDAPSAAPAAPRPSAYTLATVGAILLAAGMAVALVGVRTLRPTRPDPPRLAALPAFRLTERSGQPLTLALLRGRPWIADFIFTQCAGACPAMTARLARLQSEVPGLTFVSFTVDPAH